MKKFALASLFLVFWLISCSAPKTENTVSSNSVSENKSSESIKPDTPAAKSNRLDACAVLPRAAVERVLGQAVKSAALNRFVEGTEATAAFSQCTYQIEGGQAVEFFARRSPLADNTTEAIQKTYDTVSRSGRAEEVTGLGKAAFWVSRINQLHVFEGENIYLYFTMQNFKNEGEAKAKAAELARQAANALSAQ